MNCPSCNTTVDYRFLTNCPNCETKQPVIAPIQDPVDSEKRLTWIKRLINITYILISSMAGLIFGATVLYYGILMTSIVFVSGSRSVSHGCGNEAVAIISMLSGAFLGTVGGSVFAVKKPLCKTSVS